ncbi:hypothetical protein Wildcat_28 [Mycobacterium phage Wildcat]|uniref:Capsid maturation protease n=3 Tax=Mycobacterium virus Wildcat TaxID=1993859 RepID=Q19Y32_9CAUD|nr:hypothetical protein Wildcat_28 [Mycobacterium phage Wildcat]ABE67633.1 hypothetical protein Wildcat_28 [Mycobacterium phage Wildcat]AQT25700.1 capsid maturation protease and MuF-like fusion protein [Mycobacterium phage EniyanLRS]QGJ89918.1 capsid maturation protease and MuF-like fusion protein [Mycobacterium phage MaryV]WKR36038.1 capsid assembly protease [Mycobacterium phage Azrael100]
MARLKSLDDVVDELNRQHSADQETIANNLALALWPLWRILDFEDLDRSSILWLDASLPRIQTAYYQSQRVAAAHAANVRFATLPTAEPLPLIVPSVEIPNGVREDHFELPSFGNFDPEDALTFDPPKLDDIATSLMIEGPWSIKKQMPVTDEKAVMDAALVRTSGAAIRQSLKGARNVTHNVIKMDRKVLGYARYTDSNPCHFCAILASRGAVYSRDSFVDSHPNFRANPQAADVPSDFVTISRVHNNCRCTLRPVYSKSQEMDDDARDYRAQWKAIVEDNPGASADELMKKWREHYVPHDRTEANVLELQNQLREREDALLDTGFDLLSPQVTWARRTQTLLA